MRLTLAAAALAAVSSVALAQGTAPNGTSTVTPGTNSPSANLTGTNTPGTNAPGTAGAQTPGATVNTTLQSSSNSPSAVQTTNTTHRTGSAPVPGRNSFTMTQARGRISRAGFTNVTGLKKDNQGIWRGQAQKDGSPVSVSLDYQGNVTGQ